MKKHPSTSLRMTITLAAVVLTFNFITLQTFNSFAQTNQWTWMKGDNIVNQNGVYGTQGTPNTANKPGSREVAVSWTDNLGNLYLFGGNGYPLSGSDWWLNDLWKYTIATGDWTWIRGSSSTGQNGVYGTQGTPAAGNRPGCRSNFVSWTNNADTLWLFGGYGIAASWQGTLNDFWKYNTVTDKWTWMKGSTLTNDPSTYGTQGTPNINNKPGSRGGSVTWTDNANNLWLFGGWGFGYFNSLWKYDYLTNEWAWMEGSSSSNQPGVYGTQGTPNSANTPGSREESVSWTDNSGNLWLFGGHGYDASGTLGYLNDLWKYDIGTGNWTWIKGSSAITQSGVYGTIGTPNPANNPGSRAIPVSWKDNSGNLWLLGGNGYDALGNSGYLNDLWKYDIGTGDWTWINGDNTRNQSGVYGTMGTSAITNKPGSRNGAISWTDNSGNFWLFGGSGYDASGTSGFLNDLWKYAPASVVTPIELLSFNATAENNSLVRCEWATVSESNNDYFTVERSEAPPNLPIGEELGFVQIGTVKGAGNSSTTLNYEFFDNSLPNGEGWGGALYYRLKQTDYDGQYTYSNIRSVYIGAINLISIHPNPASDYIQYEVGSEVGGVIIVNILDVAGREVIHQEETIESGIAVRKLSTSNLSRGSYLLRITSGNQEKTQKQFVVK